MTRARALALPLATGLVLHAGEASAAKDPCRDLFDHVRTPIALDLGAADFASSPSACGTRRLSLDARGAAIVDTPDFYGSLGGAAVLAGTLPLSDRAWLTAAGAVYRYDFSQNASLVATAHGFGPLVVGAHGALVREERVQVSPFVRLLSPPETGYQHAFRAGFEHGVAALFVIGSRLAVSTSVSAPMTMTFLGARVHFQYTPRLSADAIVPVWSWLEVLAGGEVRIGTDRDGLLEFVAPRGALRFHLGRGVDLHLEAMFPVAGLERTDALVGLGAALAL